MTVAMIVSEMEPFAKTGGLADVAGALPLALGKCGLKVHVIVPRYACIQEEKSTVSLKAGVQVHFIDHGSYFKRRGLYGESNGDYPDNLQRFSFFCREALALLKREGIRPEILHAHDWQAALSIVYLVHSFRSDPFFSQVKSVFTVHNLAYQGIFPKDQFPKLELGWELFQMNGLEFYDKVNLLKGGLFFAEALTTVSPSYAREIQSPEQGEGLDGVLRLRTRELIGILNGIDQEVWNPATDPLIPARYDHRRLDGKKKGKGSLQKEFGFKVDPKSLLIGMVTRLASQKGLDLVVQALPNLKRLGIQLLILGSGDRAIEEALTQAAHGSDAVRIRLGFDPELAHRIYAGSDAFLMPSRYEPCGLGQMIALRYGTIPIVRSTGGLADTVSEYDPATGSGNGFCFGPYDAGQLLQAVRRGVDLFRDAARWQELQRRGMRTDFSWDRSAKEYLKLYERIHGANRG